MGDIQLPPAPTASTPSPAPEPCSSTTVQLQQASDEPVLCQHCGRTASNGISCQGFCVADSGY